MKPEVSKHEFETLIKASGEQLRDLVLHQGIKYMLKFYTEKQTNGPADRLTSDMLLFQWGTIGSHDLEHFDIKIARQFTKLGSSLNSTTTQLSCVFRYEATPETKEFHRGYRWCNGLPHLHAFEKFVNENDANKKFRSNKPISVSLSYINI